MNIPTDWTFKSQHVADNFDDHVREQLPWYDLATNAVAMLGRHYISRGSLVYDVGASTGNIGRALAKTLESRQAKFFAIEESQDMATRYTGPETLVVADALDYEYQPYDFAVCFLSLMFFPVGKRREWLKNMQQLVNPGGALVVVDKVVTPQGYLGTVLRRMTMDWKLKTGATPDQILQKELSLAGYQRPLSQHAFALSPQVFFTFGEFVGWVHERPE